MIPILQMINEVALALFKDENQSDIATDNGISSHDDDLSYFPSLPRVRRRRYYQADLNTKVDTNSMCTKRYSKHPVLSPGVFTLFCPHGNHHKSLQFILSNINCTGICYGFEAMKLHESPNTPFSIIYERFPVGESNETQ